MFRGMVAVYCGRLAKYKCTLIEMWRTVDLRGHVVTLSIAELSGLYCQDLAWCVSSVPIAETATKFTEQQRRTAQEFADFPPFVLNDWIVLSVKHDLQIVRSRNSFRHVVAINLFMVYVLIFPVAQTSVSQQPGRSPNPGPGINYTGPREILLELINNLNVILSVNMPHHTHKCTNTLYDYATINY